MRAIGSCYYARCESMSRKIFLALLRKGYVSKWGRSCVVGCSSPAFAFTENSTSAIMARDGRREEKYQTRIIAAGADRRGGARGDRGADGEAFARGGLPRAERRLPRARAAPHHRRPRRAAARPDRILDRGACRRGCDSARRAGAGKSGLIPPLTRRARGAFSPPRSRGRIRPFRL